MSPISYALYTYLCQQAPGSNIVMEEITHKMRASKTAVRAAFTELEAEGLLTVTQEG